jgi:hypothetical protein
VSGIGSADELLMHLLNREIVSRASAVDGKILVITDREKTYFRVFDKNGEQLFVRSGGERFAREAALYERVREDERLAPLRPLLPDVVEVDRERELLVVRTFGKANDVIEYHRMATRPAEWLPPLIGGWLALLHRSTAGFADASLARELPQPLLAAGGAVGQTPAIAGAIRRIADGWRSSAIIHGEPSFERIFIAPDGERRMQLAQWDEARLGDEAWDVATVIESYYAWSLDPDIVKTFEGPVCLLTSSDLRALVLAFWTSYIAVAGFAPGDARPLFLRAVEYAGARLLSRIDRMLSKPETATAATPMIQAAMAMLTAPAVVADIFLTPTPPVLPQAWAAP